MKDLLADWRAAYSSCRCAVNRSGASIVAEHALFGMFLVDPDGR